MKISELYQKYFKVLTEELCATYGSGPPDPEDLIQQAFEKLNRHENPEQIENPKGYLWICARNLIISEKRANKTKQKNDQYLRESLAEQANDSLNPERAVIAEKHLNLVKRELLAMTEKKRQIFLYHRYHGLTPEQAGRKYGISRTAAVKHIASASAQIANAISESQRQ